MFKELTPYIVNLKNYLVELSDDNKSVDGLAYKVTLMIVSDVTGYLSSNFKDTSKIDTYEIMDEVILKLTDLVVSELDLSCHKTHQVMKIIGMTYEKMCPKIVMEVLNNIIL